MQYDRIVRAGRLHESTGSRLWECVRERLTKYFVRYLIRFELQVEEKATGE